MELFALVAGGTPNLLVWIVVGLIAGILAKLAVPAEGPGGLLGDLILGVVGALVGGWLYAQFGHAGAITGINLPSILVAFVGAVVILLLLRLLRPVVR